MPPSESGVERQRVFSKRAPPPVQRLKLTKHHLKTQIVRTLIVVFPCMLIITQLLFQQNALIY
jgi:hypothetical protein